MNRKARLYLGMVLAAGSMVLLAATIRGGWTERDLWVMLAFALAMALAERFLIYFPLRENRVSFSLIDILLTLSLFVVPAAGVGLIATAGVLGGQLLRRQPAVKAAFNTGMYAVATSATAGTFAMLRPAELTTARAYVAAVAAMAVFFIVNKIIISIMMTFIEGRGFLSVLGSLSDIVLAIWAGSVALGLAAARLYEADAVILPLLGVPAVLSFAAYRASVAAKIEIRRLREAAGPEAELANGAR
jgi:hypothetical protein